MNKLLTLLLAGVLIVSGCVPATAEPTFTNEQLATRVNQILTTMPTYTTVPTLAPPAEEQPATGGVTAAPADTTAVPPKDTSTEVPPVVTLQPTEEPQPAATQGETQAVASATIAVETEAPTTGITQTPAPTEVLTDSDPRLTLGTPTTTDDMSSATTWNWPLGYSDFSAMTFKDGRMILTGFKEVPGWRLPIVGPVTDMYVEMKARARVCESSDNYGIIFNVPVFKEADRGYLFSVSCDGKYKLHEWDGKEGEDGKATTLIQWKSSPHIKTGANVDNRLGVMVRDEKISLYVNGMLLEEKTEDMYRDGYFGVFVNPDYTKDLTIEIDEMSFWDLD